MKKKVQCLAGLLLCATMVMPVSAAEIQQSAVSCQAVSDYSIAPRASNYFTGSTVKMNSLNGNRSAISTISSGSVLGTNPKVSSVTLNVTVSSGSSSFDLFVEDPFGNVDYVTVGRSGSVSFNSFNGNNPYGKWKVYIITRGTVSTATARMTVNYSY